MTRIQVNFGRCPICNADLEVTYDDDLYEGTESDSPIDQDYWRDAYLWECPNTHDFPDKVVDLAIGMAHLIWEAVR